MSTLRVSPSVAKLLESPENRAIFERERTIGDYLASLEEALTVKKVTKTRLAEMTGRKVTAISRAMQGKQNLTVGTMVDLAVALGKQVEVRMTDLAPIEMAVASSAHCIRASQAWAINYMGEPTDQAPYLFPASGPVGALAEIR